MSTPHHAAAVGVEGWKEGQGGDMLAPPALWATVPSSSTTASLGVTVILTLSAHNPGPRNRSKWCHHSRLCEPCSGGPVEFPDLHSLLDSRGRPGAGGGEGRGGGPPGRKLRGQGQESDRSGCLGLAV